MGARTFIVFLAVLAVLGLLGYGLLSKNEQALAVGDPAPDKELRTLGTDGSGELADYRGKWVLVNFWASWCEPCRQEVPALEELQKRLGGDRFTVVGINLDDTTEKAEEFVREFGLTYPQYRDGDGRERRDAYGMTGFPENFLIDPNGDLALIRRGPVDREYLAQSVEPLLAGVDPASQ